MSQLLKQYTTQLLAGLLLLWLGLGPAIAVDSVSLKIDNIRQGAISLKDIEVSIRQIETARPQFVLESASLSLPPPFDFIKSIRLHCLDFFWQEELLECHQGKGVIKSPQLHSPQFGFSLKVEGQQALLRLQNVKLFGGIFQIVITENGWHWNMNVTAKKTDLYQLQKFIKARQISSLQGKGYFKLNVKGYRHSIRKITLDSVVKSIDFQSKDEKTAAEGLALNTHALITRQSKGWQIATQTQLMQGGLYVEPVFLEITPEKPLQADLTLFWNPGKKKLQLSSVYLEHPGVARFRGQGYVEFQHKMNTDMVGSLTVHDLQQAASIYLQPFLETGPLADIKLTGQAEFNGAVVNNQLKSLDLEVQQGGIQQDSNHIQMRGIAADLHWAAKKPVTASTLSWQQMMIKKIPFANGQLLLSLYDKRLELLQPVDLKVLDGVISISQFHFAAVKNEDADVVFKGRVKDLSLDKLTEALDWTPLSGKISGDIPSVIYHDKTLQLGGELDIQVFGGRIVIKKLSSSGLFSRFPKLWTDIEFNNLDLKAITQKFEIGYMEGRLSGFVRNLYLEDWQPVSFYAWVGTPPDDDSRHVISQKAVENIASIGGGGAADVISRGFLRFFDTFSYDKLGFGCYLHQGVCQLMGVEAAENGYYLIKGGGLPRIDVMGYNTRMNWNVLIRRLKRIVATDNVVIQ